MSSSNPSFQQPLPPDRAGALRIVSRRSGVIGPLLERLRAAVGLLSVVATQLLRLRDLSRRDDAQARPASDVMDQEYVRVLSAWRFKEVRDDLSVHEFCRALAKRGGHLNRTHDKAAGWLVLWRGWTKLQLLVQGAAAGRIKRCV